MSIKFNCQFCQRSLKVNQELAGKKARCPGCKKIITIPTLQPAPVEIDLNLEEEAAATLAEQTAAPAGPAREKAPIKFHCTYCDEEIDVSGDLAGKQTPCPECRRIIKVPLPVKTEPKDWRKADPRGPAAGLRRDEPPPPEGAWGSAVAGSKVSQQALLEAEAIPEFVEKTTRLQWVVRILVGAAALILICVGVTAFLHFRSQSLQKKAIDKALAFVPEEAAAANLRAFEAVEVHRAAGDYFLRAEKALDARSHYKHAQARLRLEAGAKPSSVEKDLLAFDLALSQADLGGEKEEVDKGKRIKWDDVYKDLRPTFLGIASPEARIEALQQVSRKLIQRGQAKSVETLVSFLNSDKDRSEMLALVGLELAAAGQEELADQLADKALAPFVPSHGKDEKSPNLRIPPSLVVLLIVRNQETRAEELLKVSEPKELKNPAIELRLGFSQGRAFQGQWDRAHRIAMATGSARDQMAALLGIAMVAVEKNPEEARKNLEAVLGIWNGKNADPW